MSRVDVKVHMRLLKEARKYFKEVKPVEDTALEQAPDGIVLTKEHIMEWLETFEEDRIKLDGCNQASVKR